MKKHILSSIIIIILIMIITAGCTENQWYTGTWQEENNQGTISFYTNDTAKINNIKLLIDQGFNDYTEYTINESTITFTKSGLSTTYNINKVNNSYFTITGIADQQITLVKE